MRTDIDTSIFKSYDVRGIVPAQLNDDIAYAIGRAFVEVLDRKNICIGRDMRPSGPDFMAAMSRGATDAGADVTQVGLISTDAIYFAVGHYGFDGGIMITASHNPAQYNGFKFCREEAIAISIETGLAQIRGQRGATPHVTTLEQRLASDLEYIHAWSLWLDVLILLRTVPAILRPQNAW